MEVMLLYLQKTVVGLRSYLEEVATFHHISNTLHFGIADKESIDELIVSWPGNKKEIFTELQVNKTYKIIEGDGIYEYSLNYLELCEGESVFLQGTERTESGIYKDVINSTGQISEILITRLIFKSKDTCVDDPNW